MAFPFEVTPEMEIFTGQHLQRLAVAFQHSQQFAYYTSASTAALILEKEELWLRLPSVMNDFSETEHGLSLLAHSLREGQGRRIVAAYNAEFPRLGDDLIAYVSGPDPRRLFADTFIACVSEHQKTEDHTGRLSMWRAYGGISGVALTFDIEAFGSDTGSGVYSSAVEYADYARFDHLIGETATRLESGFAHVKALGRNVARDWIFDAARLAALNVKHPAFDEEKEWRLFRFPGEPLQPSLTRDIVTIEGVPQPVLKFKIPGLAHHIRKVIIGPSEFPIAVGSALIQCLVDKGVADAGKRVEFSGIPLRPQRR